MKHQTNRAVSHLHQHKTQMAALIVVLALIAGAIVGPTDPNGRKSRTGRWTSVVPVTAMG